MSGSRAGFGISITATDSGASAVIEKVNKSIQSLTASGERTGKALTKFGEVSGLSRLTEGMGSLGRTASDTFRAIDQTGSSLSALIAPITIAGVVALTRNWGAFGQGMVNMANRLQLPVEALSRLQNAAQLAGVPAQTVTNALGSLQEMLYGAAWNTDPAAVHILKDVLHIDPGTPGHVKDVGVALEEVAKALAKVADPHTKQMILDALHIDRAMLPFLDRFNELKNKADQTGANITADQAKHASELKESWDRLSLDLEGIYNRILDSWSGTTTRLVQASSRWIESNKDTADSITKIGIAITTLIGLKPAAWILRLLGLGPLVELAPVTLPLTLRGDTPTDPELNKPRTDPGFLGQGGTLEQWLTAPFKKLFGGPAGKSGDGAQSLDDQGRPIPTWDWGKRTGVEDTTEFLKKIADTLERIEGEGGGLGSAGRGGGSGGVAGTSALTVPTGPTQAAATMRSIHDFYKDKGLSEQGIAGINVNAAAESGFQWNRWNDAHDSYGIFQYHGTRLAALQAWAKTQEPSLQQQLEYSWMELQTSKAATWAAMKNATESGQAGATWSSGFEVPAGGPAEAYRRGQGAPAFEAPFKAPPPAGPRVLPPPPAAAAGSAQHSFNAPAQVNGHVQVDVALHGAPPGTRAVVASSGHARASPARIETALPFAA